MLLFHGSQGQFMFCGNFSKFPCELSSYPKSINNLRSECDTAGVYQLRAAKLSSVPHCTAPVSQTIYQAAPPAEWGERGGARWGRPAQLLARGHSLPPPPAWARQAQLTWAAL